MEDPEIRGVHTNITLELLDTGSKVMLRIEHKPVENPTEVIGPGDVVMFRNVQPFLTPELDIKLKMKWNYNNMVAIGREAEGESVCDELEIEPLASY